MEILFVVSVFCLFSIATFALTTQHTELCRVCEDSSMLTRCEFMTYREKFKFVKNEKNLNVYEKVICPSDAFTSQQTFDELEEFKNRCRDVNITSAANVFHNFYLGLIVKARVVTSI